AMEEYRQILNEAPKIKPVAAGALYHLGQCLEKSGRRSEARASYLAVLKDYTDQRQAAGARARLTNLDDTISGPLNLSFEQGPVGKLPPAWFVPALPKDGDQWAQVRRAGCMERGKCAVVLVPENAPTNAGNLMQSFAAAAYRGKMIRLTAWLRLEKVDAGDRAQMWLSIDRADGKKGFFDNMDNRPVRSAEWTPCQLEARVEDDATFVKFGVMSIGRGRVWVDRVSLEVLPTAHSARSTPP
ncbi:MAG: tetratricopeptide repeat protein, partial [Bryobacteraceae bacterium]